MILDTTTRKLQVVLGEAHTTNALAVVASWFDSGATPSGGPSLINTNGTTAVDAVAAPASGYIRQVNELTVFNADTVDHNVTIQFNDNATLYTIVKQKIIPGQSITYSKALGWNVTPILPFSKQPLGAFFVNRTSAQTGLTASNYNVITYNNTVYDTEGWFTLATGKWQPLVAGYYLFVGSGSASATDINCSLSLNGTRVQAGPEIIGASTPSTNGVAGIIHLNGSTDYVQLQFYPGTATATSASSSANYLQGILLTPDVKLLGAA